MLRRRIGRGDPDADLREPRVTPPLSRRARWRRTLLRRGLAACCAAAAVLALAAVVRPPAPPSVAVVVAARDLPAGARLTAADLQTRQVPTAQAPPVGHASAEPLEGAVLVGPITAGEAVTDSRLLSSAIARLPSGRAVAHLVVADPAALALTPAGTRVAVYAAAGGPALARQARVVAVDTPPPDPTTGGNPTTSGGVVLDLSPSDMDAIFTGQRTAEGAPQVLLVREGRSGST